MCADTGMIYIGGAAIVSKIREHRSENRSREWWKKKKKWKQRDGSGETSHQGWNRSQATCWPERYCSLHWFRLVFLSPFLVNQKLSLLYFFLWFNSSICVFLCTFRKEAIAFILGLVRLEMIFSVALDSWIVYLFCLVHFIYYWECCWRVMVESVFVLFYYLLT